MDLQTTLICAGVFVVSALVVYLISVFGMRERTYEEAIEEQRRLNQEAIQHSKSEKSKKEKKFKKWGRKSKDKTDDDKSSPGEESIEDKLNHDHNEFKPEAEVILTDPDCEIKQSKPKKKGKNISPLKPILISKDENDILQSSSEDTDEQRSRSNSFTAILPKDEVELKHIHEKDDSKISTDSVIQDDKDLDDSDEEQLSLISDAETKNEEIQTKVTEQEMIDKDVITTLQQNACAGSCTKLSPGKKTKKNHKNDNFDCSGDGTEVSEGKLLTMIKSTTLSDEEALMIIDFLSNKQQGIGGWTKKNDPLAAVKKQLQEKEQTLEAEQRLTHAANSKLKDLRQELSQEKSRSSAAERSLREKMNQQQQEIQALHGRMQRSHEQHLSDTSALQNKIQQLQTKMSEEHNLAIQRLQEENSQLQQALSRLETEGQKRNSMEVSRLQHEVEQLLSTRDKYETRQAAMQQAQDDLHHQIQQLEEHIEKLVASHQDEEFTFKQRLNDMSNKLQQTENARSSLVQELQNAQSVCSSFESDNSSLRQRLDEAKHQISNKEQEMQQLQSRLEETCQQQRDLAACLDQLQNEVVDLTNKQNEHIRQIDDLKQEKDDLAVQLTSAVERMAAEGSESPQQNGDILQKEDVDSQKKIDLCEHEKMMEEKESCLLQLRDSLNKHKAEVLALAEELENQKKKNNELREKNWKAMEALTTSEKRLHDVHKESEHKLKEERSKADERLQDLEKSLQEQYCHELAETREEISRIQKDAKERIVDIQRISEQNVQEIKVNLDSEVKEAQQLANTAQAEAKKAKEELVAYTQGEHKKEQEFLQRMFPSIKVDNCGEHDSWRSAFEHKALELLQKLKDMDSQSAATKSLISNKTQEIESLKLQLAEAVEYKSKLEAQVHHYKFVLSETEGILNRLQNSVETEEQVWKDKLSSKEKELEEAMEENKKLIAERKVLEANLEQLQGLEEATSEMQFKLIELQSKLQGEENEKRLLEQKFDEVSRYGDLLAKANKSALDLRDQLEHKLKEMEDLQRDKTACEEIKKELELVQTQLDKERRISKDLSAKAVKLNSLVKIGQDALQAEQELVKDLQAQLQATKGATANGSSTQIPIEATPQPITLNQVNSGSMPVKRKKSRKRGGAGKK